MKSGLLRITCALGFSAICTSTQAAVVEAFAQVVGGQSTASQYASALPTIGNFNFGSFGVFQPTSGNYPEVAEDSPPLQSAATGSVTNSAALTTTFANLGSTLTGTAAVNAQSGSVGARATASLTSEGRPNVIGAQAAGIFSETLSLSSAGVAPGTAGSVKFGFTIDGGVSVTGGGALYGPSGVAALYYLSNDPGDVTRILLNIQASGETSLPDFYANPTTGFTVSNGSAVGGSTYYTSEVPMTWGTPFDLTFGLLAYVIPATGQNGQVDFLSTGQLTSIAVKANGQLVDSFDVDTASGAIYTANGVSIVPLPAALPLMLGGLIGLGSVSLRRTRN